jgi:hypothetical protein
MMRLAAVLFFATVTVSSSVASATVLAFVHGRNSGTPTAAEGCDYWGSPISGSSCISAGSNGASTADSASPFSDKSAYWEMGWTVSDPVIRYDATQAWWSDTSSTDPICALAAQINASGQTSVHIYAHSAGTLVTAGLLTDAANNWSVCGDGGASVRAAANRITMVGLIAGPLRGTKVADAVYGHLTANGGNPLSDFFHNLCGNSVGSIANTFFDQSSSMTYALQSAQVQNNAGWMNNLAGKTTYLFWGTSASNGDDAITNTALAAAASCGGLGQNDGLVESWSARACVDSSCCSKIAGYGSEVAGGAWSNVNHSANRRGTTTTSSNSFGHNHGFSDMLYYHFGAL